jgi:hypothetical protein
MHLAISFSLNNAFLLEGSAINQEVFHPSGNGLMARIFRRFGCTDAGAARPVTAYDTLTKAKASSELLPTSQDFFDLRKRTE